MALRDFRLYVLLAIAAAARLLLQMSALPPYAGLDEIFHVHMFRQSLVNSRCHVIHLG